MTITHIQNVLQYLNIDEVLLKDDDPSSYNSYTIPDDTVVQVIPAGNDDPEWYTITYVQVIKEHGKYIAICQLEGLPEDPANFKFHTDMSVRIYKQIL